MKVLGALLGVCIVADAHLELKLSRRDAPSDCVARRGISRRQGAEASVLDVYTWSDGGSIYANSECIGH